MTTAFWGALTLIFLIIEIATPAALVTIWFAAGSLVALLLSFFKIGIIWEVCAAIISTILFIAFLRPMTVKLLKVKPQATNTDKYIGTVATLIEPITEETWGRIKLQNVEWCVKEEEGKALPAGTKVKLIAIDGAKFIVQKVNKGGK